MNEDYIYGKADEDIELGEITTSVSSLLKAYADNTYKVWIDPIDEPDSNVKMLLFARWITTVYGTPEYNVNGYDGSWWKEQLNHFNAVVYPNYEKNGSVGNTKKFLEE